MVVNLGNAVSQGVLRLSGFERGHRCIFHDELNDARYERDGEDLARNGLFVRLAPHQAHIFALT